MKTTLFVLGSIVAAMLGMAGQEAALPQKDRVGEIEKRLTDVSARLKSVEDRLARVEKGPSSTAAAATPKPNSRKLPVAGAAYTLIGVTLTKKVFVPSDILNGRPQDVISFDAKFDATGLKNAARSVKGTVEFCDLFGEVKYRAGWTINDSLEPKGVQDKTGLTIDFNPFLDGDNWLRATDVADMVTRFKVTSILYADGERADFE